MVAACAGDMVDGGLRDFGEVLGFALPPFFKASQGFPISPKASQGFSKLPKTEQTSLPPAGGQYCVGMSGFARREPRECTTVLDRGERPGNHPGKKRTPHPSAGGQYCVERSGFARREPRECTTVLDRGERPSKARDFPQDCSPYMTMMPNTRANSATVSTIPQMVR